MRVKCVSCREYNPLIDSHIVPKFIFKWMKKIGSNGLRLLTNINKREEDGPKIKLLCQSCESLFSRSETYFSNQFFHPILSDLNKNDDHTITEFKYSDELYKFCVSLLWRALRVNLNDDNVPLDKESVLEELEQKWRIFLLENRGEGLPSIHMAIFNQFEDFEDKPDYFDIYNALHGCNYNSWRG